MAMKVAEFKPRKLDGETTRAIKRLLEGAISGDVTDVCWVAKVRGQWVYKYSNPEVNTDRLTLVGMMESVKQRVILMLDWGKL